MKITNADITDKQSNTRNEGVGTAAFEVSDDTLLGEPCIVLTIPTKQDGDQDLTSSALNPSTSFQEPAPADRFLYFSSDKNRMEHLLGRELPDMPDVEPIVRKKSLSFELDPLYDMMNSFPELFADVETKRMS